MNENEIATGIYLLHSLAKTKAVSPHGHAQHQVTKHENMM